MSMIKKPSPSDVLRYFTKRELVDKNGKQPGFVTIWVFPNEDVANIELTCPFCGKISEFQQEWVRNKSGTLKTVCPACKKKVNVPRMKR